MTLDDQLDALRKEEERLADQRDRDDREKEYGPAEQGQLHVAPETPAIYRED